MTRALLCAIAALAAAPAAARTEAPLPLGRVVERVACAADASQSYALYLPSGYTPERRWPILYAFDPRERGELPVELVRATAEELGWIVASTHNFRSDEPTTAGAVAAMKALWEDTHARLAIDPRRVYAA